MTEQLDVQDVSVVYSEQRDEKKAAIEGVSFSLKKGQAIGIAGETGAGKSTLARALAAMESLRRGRVFIDGDCVASADKKEIIPPARLRTARRKFQILFQDATGSLSPRMPIEAIVAEGALAHGLWPKSETSDRVAALLSRLNLDPAMADRYPNELSGGEKKRVALARVLALAPRLLILDEPTAGLDPHNIKDLLAILQSLRQQEELSLVVVSHDLSVLRELTDRMLLLRRGAVVEAAETAVFFAGPATDYGRAFLKAATGDVAWIAPAPGEGDPE